MIFFILSGACFLLAFAALVVRSNPKPWRRKYQTLFEADEPRNINRNKTIDERIPGIALIWTIVLLCAAVISALLGMAFADVSDSEDDDSIPDVEAFRQQIEGEVPEFSDRPPPASEAPTNGSSAPLPERGSVF